MTDQAQFNQGAIVLLICPNLPIYWSGSPYLWILRPISQEPFYIYGRWMCLQTGKPKLFCLFAPATFKYLCCEGTLNGYETSCCSN